MPMNRSMPISTESSMLDATVVDLCLSLFPWATFRRTKAGVKLHTLLDLRGNIPSFIRITNATVHDVNILDELVPEPGSYYVMDRGYLDFARLYRFEQEQAFFLIRAKSNLRCHRLYSRPVDKATGLICDQTVVLDGYCSGKGYPEKLRRVRYFDADEDRRLTFLTNNFTLPALTIAQLYRRRWQIELFFKWIKQHLRIKAFYGTSSNAIHIQIWTAITIYVLVALVKKQLCLDADLYTILQVLSVTCFEKTPILQALAKIDNYTPSTHTHNQLVLFN
jgi:IS4 transposase